MQNFEPSLIRTWLFGPGMNAKIHKAMAGSGADALIVDLEDSTPLAYRVEARRGLAPLFAAWQHMPFVRAVRINGLETEGLEDLGVAMQAGAQHLLGEHDFTSFRATGCQALSPVKNMMRIDISRKSTQADSAVWRFEFEASAFLHHMIRNIMGCMIKVGTHHRPPEWMAEVLAARDRNAAAPTFSPDGLYFLGPRYDPKWDLPERTPAYDGLP